VKAADTSVVVAAFASWHEKHDVAHRAIDRGVDLVAHCALETYSVLTRLPAPHRVSGALVWEFLAGRFPRPFLQLADRQYRTFLGTLADAGVTGGAAYDALVGATAVAAGAELVTCDRRALPIYERFGVRIHLL
jgi:predicted nucleic acid-binding protein